MTLFYYESPAVYTQMHVACYLQAKSIFLKLHNTKWTNSRAFTPTITVYP